jgi:hypothetical protein
MARRVAEFEVLGPWSLQTSRRFWEGFTPAALASEPARAGTAHGVLIARHGQDGAFPPPHTLARLDLDLPGRKSEYLRAVAEAALDGLLDGAALRAIDPGQAVQNAPDALPRHERRLDAEITERYGPGRTLAEVSQVWRPYR